MSPRRPGATLTLDGQGGTAAESALADLRVEIGVGAAHDRAQAHLGPLTPFGGVAPGATATVALGDGDDSQDVLTGTVVAVEHRAAGVVVEILAATSALSATRLGRAFVQTTVADVVEGLASEAGVSVDAIDAPASLGAYHVDERRPAWSHVQQLARLTASEVSCSPGGGLRFRPPRTGAADHRPRFGAELVAWDVGPREAPRPELAVVPFGAASEQGADHWHVVLREPDCGSPSGPVLVPPALRDRDAASALETGLRDAAGRAAAGGTVTMVGDPAVRAGDLVELADLPEGDPGTLRVVAVTHRFAPGGGFLTRLRVEGAQ